MAPFLDDIDVSTCDTPSTEGDEHNATLEVADRTMADSAHLALLQPGLAPSVSAPNLRRQGDHDLLGAGGNPFEHATRREREVMGCYGRPPQSSLRRGPRSTRAKAGQSRGLSVGELRRIAYERQPAPGEDAAEGSGKDASTKCEEPLQKTRTALRALRKASRGTLWVPPFHHRRSPPARVKVSDESDDRDADGFGLLVHTNGEEGAEGVAAARRALLPPAKAKAGAARPHARRNPFLELEAREKRLNDERKWLHEDASYLARRHDDLRHNVVQTSLAQQGQPMDEAYDRSILYTNYAIHVRASARRQCLSAGRSSQQPSPARASSVNLVLQLHEGHDKDEAISRVKQLQQEMKLNVRQGVSAESSAEADRPHGLHFGEGGRFSFSPATKVAWAVT